MRFPGFIGPSYQLRSINVDCQRCVNLYPEFDEMQTAKEKSIGALVGTPGLSSPLFTLPTSPYRGSFVASNGNYYICAGNTLYQISSSWVATSVGTILTSTGPVSMKDNGVYLMLVDGTNGWSLFFTDPLLPPAALTKITSANYLGPASGVEYQDGVFIYNIPGTNQFFVSDSVISSGGGSTFSGLFDAKSSSPDHLIGILSDHRNLWLFGNDTTEVWFDAGNAPPSTTFSLIQGGYIETGLAAQFSLQKINNTILFLGRDKRGTGKIYSISGFQPTRVSTQAIERVIQSLGDISGSTSWTYQVEGHEFYAINFANASGQYYTSQSTWVYDLQTNLWHERVFLDQGLFQRSLIQGHDYVFNTHVVGDYQSGNIYELSDDIFTDNGAYIPRQRVFPHLNADMKRLFYHSLQLDLQPGVGIDGSGQGTNPKAILQFSDDGGHSWSNEKVASVGKIGEGKHRVIWRRLGQARDKVFRITQTDPVKTVWIGATINGEEGSK